MTDSTNKVPRGCRTVERFETRGVNRWCWDRPRVLDVLNGSLVANFKTDFALHFCRGSQRLSHRPLENGPIEQGASPSARWFFCVLQPVTLQSTVQYPRVLSYRLLCTGLQTRNADGGSGSQSGPLRLS
jgi:hypothetical protein